MAVKLLVADNERCNHIGKAVLTLIGSALATAVQAVTVGTVDELKSAVSGAKDGDEIVVSASGSPYVLDATLLSTCKNLVLRGDAVDPRTVVLDGNRSGKCGISLGDGCTVKSLTVSNVICAQTGAGCLMGKNAWVENCIFTVCTNTSSSSTSFGGGLKVGSGTVTNCQFVANGSSLSGGGGFCAGADGDVYVAKTVFVDNFASTRGGAIYHAANASNRKVYLADCAFTNNVANEGGCVRGRFDIRRCDFAGNRAKTTGGVVFSKDTPADNGIYDSYFTNNVAEKDGGALRIETGSWTVSNCTFVANESSTSGGAISWAGFSAGQQVMKCRFYANQATGGSGGASDGAIDVLKDCVFVGNRAKKKGGTLSGVAAVAGVTNWIVNVSITNSIAQGGSYDGGGAITGGDGTKATFTIVSNLTVFGSTCTTGDGGAFMTKSPTAIYDSHFMHCTNTWSNASGGAVSTSADLVLENCTFDDCSVQNTTQGHGGGALSATAGATVMTNCTFRDCYSSSDGGAAYVSGAAGAYRCVFKRNRAKRFGGGCCGNATCAGGFVECVFSENISTNAGNSSLTSMKGAAFYSTGSGASVEQCTFASNVCFGSHGGGICVAGGTLSVRDSTFFRNKQLRPDRTTKTVHGGAGGGIGVAGGDLVLVDRCRFVENVADTSGGAIGNYHGGSCTLHGDIRNSLFLRNSTDDCMNDGCGGERAGGALALAYSNITVSCCTLVSNVCHTTAYGGGIAGKSSESQTAIVENCLLWDNVANGSTTGGNTANRCRSTNYFFNYDSQGDLPSGLKSV